MSFVVITGASSGIGRQMAYEFARNGNDLLLVARNRENLQELKEEIISRYQVNADIFACDLSKDAKKLFVYYLEKGYDADILINNAGFGDYGRFDKGDVDKYLNMIDLNNRALVELTYCFVNEMKKKKSGQIINTGSVASFIPGPYMAVYYASKAFVLSFSLSLREELKDDGISVSVLCPAPTRTAFWDRANGQTTAVYDNVFARSDRDAARVGYLLSRNKKAFMIDGFIYKLMIRFARHLPLTLCARIVGSIQARTKRPA